LGHLVLLAEALEVEFLGEDETFESSSIERGFCDDGWVAMWVSMVLPPDKQQLRTLFALARHQSPAAPSTRQFR